MDLMRETPDNHFDLAIVDPPYGIGVNKGGHTLAGNGKFKGGNFKVEAGKYAGGEWDANHYISRMPWDGSGWIVWDKDNGDSYQAVSERQ